MNVTLVDWLGRGGIAQTSETWAVELARRGHHVTVATRHGRELHPDPAEVVTASTRGGALAAHARLARVAAATIRERRPDCVVVQNYVVPPLEASVYDAARAVGAQLVVVVHDDRLHSWRAGTRLGLRHHLRHADVVIAHTRAVARRVTRDTGRAVRVLPHPVPIGMVAARNRGADHPPGGRWAAHFGVLRRGYKGTALVEALAGTVSGWAFVVLGVGAPASQPNLVSIPGFVTATQLVDTVAASDATILPYSYATQSGAVVLAQALGSVPVVTAVGGIPEQVTDGHDGLLLAPDADATRWRDALHQLDDAGHRRALGRAGTQRVWAQHARFTRGIEELVA
jgi:glycosyltransferase involved in cell wall biosynthesis